MQLYSILIDGCDLFRADFCDHGIHGASFSIGEPYHPEMRSLKTEIAFYLNGPRAVDKAQRIAAAINSIMSEADAPADDLRQAAE